MTTGFHGLHVTIGTIFLLFCLLRSLITASRFLGQNSLIMVILRRLFHVTTVQQEQNLSLEVKSVQHLLSKYAFTKDQHLGFEAAA